MIVFVVSMLCGMLGYFLFACAWAALRSGQPAVALIAAVCGLAFILAGVRAWPL